MTIQYDNTTNSISVVGTETNLPVNIQTKGTGALNLAAGSSGVNISNGTTVTAITRTNVSATYTSVPTVIISAPTTAGGVQATASPTSMIQSGNSPTINGGGTGYTNGDVLTIVGGTPTGSAATMTVTSVSGGVITGVNYTNFATYTVLPTAPFSVTGGTGSGATFTSGWYPLSYTITNAGSGYVEQPTVTFSGGGGSGAAAYASVGSVTTIKGIGSASERSIAFQGPNGFDILQLDGSNPTTTAEILRIQPTQFGRTNVIAVGSANSQMWLSASGSGFINFATNGTALTTQARVTHTASAVNFVQATGSATLTGGPTVSAQGSDSNIPIRLQYKGSAGFVDLVNAAGWSGLRVQTANTPNFIQINGTASGTAPSVTVASSSVDTNVPITLQTKGTGALNLAPGSSGVNISNGTTVTAITRTNAGSGYTGIPAVAISAPTTAGGVQATATVAMEPNTITIASGGTGYTLNDVLTFVGGTIGSQSTQVTVTGVSGGVITSVNQTRFGRYTGLPTNPISVTGGTGSGATFNCVYVIAPDFTITNAGSGYVEQPTVTFSGGGGSGAAAYATVGSTPVVRTLGSAMDFFTPSGRQFSVSEQFSAGSVAANWIQVSGRGAGAGPTIASQGADTNINLLYVAKGTGAHVFTTASGATDQLRVTHTASAVNFVQVTGAATGANPSITVQGSDAARSLNIGSKGTTFVILANNGTVPHFSAGGTGSAVNYLNARGSATGSGPQLEVVGADTNIPLVLQPKGTGALQAQQTDSTATGGNARGANAVDWQTVRGAASQVASGANAVIGGGLNNTAGANSYAVVAGGFNNTATGVYGNILGGTGNTASGYHAGIVAGNAHTAGGFFNFIGGGSINTGTANAAVTTQATTTVTSGSTAVTLSGSNASIRVGQMIRGTGMNDFTYVAAISGTSLTLSMNAGASGSPTLSFFTPHGVVVGGGNNQATGSYSFIGGGGDAGTAANRNVASGSWSSVVGGRSNTASGDGSFIGGGGLLWFADGAHPNTATGKNSFVGAGSSNNATGTASAILGGTVNNANSIFSTAIGAYGSTRSISGNLVFSSGTPMGTFAAGVGSQAAMLVLGRQTTDATATVLTSDGAAASTSNQVIMPNNSAYFFRGEVVSGVTGGGNTKGWTVEGVIKRGANAASTTLVGTPTVTSSFADAGASTWTIAVTADTTNGGLQVTFTGQLATTIRTVAQIRTTEMTF